ncbi:hypothetical protein LAC81_30265 [Ensifer adhaerens]|uniref:hypothetical protein n=1 Tax=Ensifer adhaerens TaxID=106592 RepID=UPI001CC09ADB|nr:hypothetical protein [Ensifer adhaerens]MBZ7925025.1 hypothetical protein [Ensifer adhaerens]UAX95778.1 hypothetical protein LAC78_33565 [Ensifer adhaerens]UAY04881.1 hypothetical protein LAC80_26745 [Ensifer adhaerens]UAY10313.1 hypothetical protein LAC81_30265 [Ensifer adhaerens]
MFNGLDLPELKRRESEIFVKCWERKWVLDAAGIPATHDKLFCLWKWQLEEIEAVRNSAAA